MIKIERIEEPLLSFGDLEAGDYFKLIGDNDILYIKIDGLKSPHYDIVLNALEFCENCRFPAHVHFKKETIVRLVSAETIVKEL